MKVLVPIDGSECSFRALEYAIEEAWEHDSTLEVVHITDHQTETIERLMDRARNIVEDEGVDENIDIVFDIRKFRRASQIGKNILEIAEEDGIDHIVMDHHGTGAIGRAILGSAAETVVRSANVPVTVIP